MAIALVRTFLLYGVIIIAVRIMGKRQISELQTNELVVTMLISDLASIPMQDTGQPLLSGLIPIMILVSCEIIVSVVMLKSSKFRKLICGYPLIVIRDGKIDQKQMNRLRMSTEDLFQQLRQLDVFSLSDVSYAIVETNGKMSVLKKAPQQEVTPEILNLSVPSESLEVIVVSDGQIEESSLEFVGLGEDFIKNTLDKEGIQMKDVFIMTANKNSQYNIIKKEYQT